MSKNQQLALLLIKAVIIHFLIHFIIVSLGLPLLIGCIVSIITLGYDLIDAIKIIQK